MPKNEFGMHILITGNPVGGFEFFGPFNNGIEATDFAAHLDEQEFWTAKLRSPEEITFPDDVEK